MAALAMIRSNGAAIGSVTGAPLLGDLQFASDAVLINEVRHETVGLLFFQEGLHLGVQG